MLGSGVISTNTQLRTTTAQYTAHFHHQCSSSSSSSNRSAKIYIYKSPLIGWERVVSIADALGPASDSLALHAGIVVDADGVVLHDFVPADPTSPITAARLLAGGSVPGALCDACVSRAPYTS